MKVQNVKIVDNSINLNDSKFKEIVLKHKNLLPNLTKKTVSFELIDSNEAFANGIRRVFNDELDIKVLNADINNINTDDKFILPDNIKERLNLLPINQSILHNKLFNISITNDTNEIINIYSKDILNKDKTDKVEYFNKNVQICSLRPKKYISISNIGISTDKGYENNVYCLGSFTYKCINTDFNIPSLNNKLSDFAISFTNNYNAEPKEIINMIYDNLYFRMKKIQTEINDYIINNNSEDVNKINNDLYILKNTKIVNLKDDEPGKKEINDLYEIHINKEYHTIGNLICKYVFLVDPNIELINYKLIHVLTHKIIITIKHVEYKKIINLAINKFLDDLKIFKSAF